MGNHPSAKGAPDEEEGGGSEGHGHETISGYTAEEKIGGKPTTVAIHNQQGCESQSLHAFQ